MQSITSTGELGSAIRTRRKELGLSQEDLALSIGVNRRVVGDLERGKPTVRSGIALAAVQALGMNIELSIRGERHA